MEDFVKSLEEIQGDSVHYLLHINKVGYFVLESDPVCHAQLALGESMLAFPNHVLHLTCDGLQEDLFHIFPSH